MSGYYLGSMSWVSGGSASVVQVWQELARLAQDNGNGTDSVNCDWTEKCSELFLPVVQYSNSSNIECGERSLIFVWIDPCFVHDNKRYSTHCDAMGELSP
jgi:hypothetical protein